MIAAIEMPRRAQLCRWNCLPIKYLNLLAPRCMHTPARRICIALTKATRVATPLGTTHACHACLVNRCHACCRGHIDARSETDTPSRRRTVAGEHTLLTGKRATASGPPHPETAGLEAFTITSRPDGRRLVQHSPPRRKSAPGELPPGTLAPVCEAKSSKTFKASPLQATGTPSRCSHSCAPQNTLSSTTSTEHPTCSKHHAFTCRLGLCKLYPPFPTCLPLQNSHNACTNPQLALCHAFPLWPHNTASVHAGATKQTTCTTLIVYHPPVAACPAPPSSACAAGRPALRVHILVAPLRRLLMPAPGLPVHGGAPVGHCTAIIPWTPVWFHALLVLARNAHPPSHLASQPATPTVTASMTTPAPPGAPAYLPPELPTAIPRLLCGAPARCDAWLNPQLRTVTFRCCVLPATATPMPCLPTHAHIHGRLYYHRLYNSHSSLDRVFCHNAF